MSEHDSPCKESALPMLPVQKYIAACPMAHALQHAFLFEAATRPHAHLVGEVEDKGQRLPDGAEEGAIVHVVRPQ